MFVWGFRCELGELSVLAFGGLKGWREVWSVPKRGASFVERERRGEKAKRRRSEERYV